MKRLGSCTAVSGLLPRYMPYFVSFTFWVEGVRQCGVEEHMCRWAEREPNCSTAAQRGASCIVLLARLMELRRLRVGQRVALGGGTNKYTQGFCGGI